MNFLQPWMLFALPLIALPVVIHLIHRNRHRSLPWAAMMFLIKANRMNKGMARIRYLLIMAMRVLALAALIWLWVAHWSVPSWVVLVWDVRI